MHQCIELARKLGREVQLALNIIPRPQERELLLEELVEVAAWGLDAVIVNDPGVLREIQRTLPGLAIGVSIGCGALNVDDVLFYQDLGASAVVLPGYLEPREIAAIKATSSMAVEVMLHMVEEFLQLGKCAVFLRRWWARSRAVTGPRWMPGSAGSWWAELMLSCPQCGLYKDDECIPSN